MAVETSSRPTFVATLSVLFYFSTWMGVMPYSIRAYARHRVLKPNIISNVYVGLQLVQLVVQYHFASSAFSMGDKKESGTLTVIIGYVIIYMEPLMLAVDVLGFLIHQRLLVRLLAHMQHVDDQLARQHVHMNYGYVRRLTVRLLAVVTVIEASIVTYNFVLFQEVDLESAWWFITCMPLFLSSVAKVWFILLMTNVRMKFEAINGHMQDIVQHYIAIRERNERIDAKQAQTVQHNSAPRATAMPAHYDNGFFLQHEIGGKRPAFRASKVSQRTVDVFTVPQKAHGIVQVQPLEPKPPVGQPLPPYLFSAPADKQQLNRRLTALCQLHDEICDIGKGINRLFSFQMLILMAYGFMSLTAKLYFVFCGMTNQNIPILFRSAESLPVSVTFIVYTGAKCVYMIYISWQTKLTAQRTGVMLHKVANVVDDNDCYVVVNHLSLKLLNHHLNFTACGFFDLDMTTLYAVRSLRHAITNQLNNKTMFRLPAR